MSRSASIFITSAAPVYIAFGDEARFQATIQHDG